MEIPMQITKKSEKSVENQPKYGKDDYNLTLFIVVSHVSKTFSVTESLYRCEYMYQLSL